MPIVINTYAGVQNTDPDLLEAARSFGAKRGQLFRYIMLPGALPYIVTGLRLGGANAMVGTVIAELYTALSGLGYLIAQFGGTFQTAKYFAPVLVLSGLGYAAQPVAEDCRAAARAMEIHAGRALIGLCMGVSVLVSGCEVAPPPTITPPPSTPRSIPTLEGTRPLAVAVPVGTPTPTVPIVGDYSTLVRDRLVARRVGVPGARRTVRGAADLADPHHPVGLAERHAGAARRPRGHERRVAGARGAFGCRRVALRRSF